MRRAARTDDNQTEIVKGLRKHGVKVQSTAAIGAGFPDLLCGYEAVLALLEVKDGKKAPSAQKLTPDQTKWHAEWEGMPVFTVRSLAEALAVFGIKEQL